MKRKCNYLFITLAAALGLMLVLLWSTGYGRAAYADSGILYVAVDGHDGNDCASIADRCQTVQRAVDVARPGDEIRVAAGVYTGVSARAGITQMVYIDKSVTIRGGYATSNWESPDPKGNLTILDAQGQGRVLYIAGNIHPTVDGFRITGGDATGLSGDPWRHDAGGGVYIYNAAAILSNCVIDNNVASMAGSGSGGGVFLRGSRATLHGNEIISNTASTAAYGNGGGMFLWGSAATVDGNTVQDNIASTVGWGYGGGLFLVSSAAVLRDNWVVNNTAGAAHRGFGGGLYVSYSKILLENSMIVGNTASGTEQGYGGGVYLNSSPATLRGNTVRDNVASIAGPGYGGGMNLWESPATLYGNRIIHNSTGAAASGYGGGLVVQRSLPFTITNTLIADNYAQTAGGGLWLKGADTKSSSGRILHATIADNRGGGAGVFVGDYTTLAFTNTIIAGHPQEGITVTSGSTVALEATLWYDNGTDMNGGGSITTGAINIYDSPAFVDPSTLNYHLSGGSAAIDAGVHAGVMMDLDNNLRPLGRPDLGAYEWSTPMFLPLMFRHHGP